MPPHLPSASSLLRREALWCHAAWLALAMLVLLQLALFAFATLVTDSGRDLANAFAAGHGGPYPHYGPSLFGRWQLGPVWFWLLALPLRLGGSITLAALFVGLLAALKIPLAWAIGKRMLGARFGVLAALLVALPGWSSVGSLVIAHTSVVESALLATVWLALMAWQERRAGAALMACLMLSLALHAHPTTLIAAPAVALALWRALLLPRRWGLLLLAGLLFLLPFLPALWAEMRSGWPQATASLAYLNEADPIARLQRVPQVLWDLLTGGAWFAGHFLLPAPAASLWWLLHGLALLLALPGALRLVLRRSDLDETGAASARRWLFALLIGTLAACVFIVLLRDATPTWMIYVLAPPGVFLLALCWHGLLLERRAALPLMVLLAVAVLGVNLALLQQRMALEQAGQILLPGGSIGHISTPRSTPRSHSPWLSVRQFDALARHSCAAPARMTLHGELATTFDFAQGVASRLHCPPDRLPRLGGITADQHLFGINRELAPTLGFAVWPEDFGHVLRVPVQVLAPAQGRDAEVDVRYRPERQAALDAQGDSTLSGEVICPPDHMLVITNLMPILNRLDQQVSHADTALAPHAQTRASHYYRCDGSLLHWRIETPDPASADVVVVKLGAEE